jgi:FKBP-type peptidyl-prolyl cis-trans isomerase FkpA
MVKIGETMRPFGQVVIATLAAMSIACGGGATQAASTATGAAPQPAFDEVTQTTFASALNVRLDSMLRRPSGLYVQDMMMGTGAVATRGRTIVVRYAGFLPTGKQFDSGEITVTLGTFKTIRAWEEGLLGIRVGGRRRLVVPPSLGYGSKGAGETIPPNSVLVFDIEALAVR